MDFLVILLLGSFLVVEGFNQFPSWEYGGLGEDLGQRFFQRRLSQGGVGGGDFGPNVLYHNPSSGGGSNPIFDANYGAERFNPSDEGGETNFGNTNNGRKIHKFVSVHIAPFEEPNKQKGPPTPPKKPDTHYQIVFIKAPSPSGPDGQEFQLPPPPETKTLVYVLLKKPSLDLAKFKAQQTPKPIPPEVFFIRYKGNNKGQGQSKNSVGGGDVKVKSQSGFGGNGSDSEDNESQNNRDFPNNGKNKFQQSFKQEDFERDTDEGRDEGFEDESLYGSQ